MRKIRITPWKPNDRRVYCATFNDARGRRVTRSLGTEDESAALLICAGLARLAQVKVKSKDEAPADVARHVVALYCGEPRPVPVSVEIPVGPKQDMLDDPERRNDILVALVERERVIAENVVLRRELERVSAELAAIKNSAIARALKSEGQCPSLKEALAQFEGHMTATTAGSNAKAVVAIAQRFVDSIPGTKSPTEVTPAQINRWLDSETKDVEQAVARRAKLRNRLGRFLGWCATTWAFVSPMTSVRAPSKSQLQRERGEIHWHELADVEAALAKLPTEYWKTLVSTLAFAGLRLAELVWLRRSDVQQLADGRRQLWITTVQDGHGGRHALKTGHSERAVEIHPKRLWPLIEAHLKDRAGEVFLFPMPPDMRRRSRESGGHPERWVEHTLGLMLSGDTGGKALNKEGELSKPPRPGLLPKGMGPASLRRTFGSLLLRSGASVAAVAAAMGNTPNVVQTHYARILGSEVRVAF